MQYWLLASLPIKGFQMVTEPLTLMKTATKTLPQAPAPATVSLSLCCMQTSLGWGLVFLKKKSTIPEHAADRPFYSLKSTCGCELFYILLRNYQTTSEND